MNLRPYQQEAFDSTVVGFEQWLKLLDVLPTGSGKTVLFAHLAAHYQPGKTLILAHREELLQQAADKIFAATGLRADMERADLRASLDAPVVVGSVKTLMRAKRRERWPHNHWSLIVVDEAHHILADSYQSTLKYFTEDSATKVLGVTATPDRGDKKNLRKYFDACAYEISLVRLIKEGWLSPIKVKTLPVKMDLRGLKRMAGDYSADDLGEAIEPYLEKIADEMAKECWSRKTIVFLPLVKTARRMAEILARRGIDCRSVSGYDDDRAETLAWFAKAGPGTALCNAMLLTEGYDQPDVDCIVNLRPTQVRSLYAQMVGRGTRLSPATGKEDMLLLDFLWQTERLNLVSPARLITGNEMDVATVQKVLDEAPANGDGELDIIATCEDAERKRFRAVAEAINKNSQRKAGTSDAIEMCLSLGARDLVDFEPLNERQAMPPTQPQITMLERAGFAASGITCFGHASAILDRLAVRRMENLATPKQVRLLERLRHPLPGMATFAEASAFINSELGERR